MAGTIHSIIESFEETGTQTKGFQELFTTIYNFLAAHKTLVSLQWGSAGTGTGYWDSSSPFGVNAFAVFKFPAAGSRTWYWQLLLQFTSSYNFGTAPGDPGLCAGSTSPCIGMQAAIGIDGVGAEFDPWLGTKLASGTDRKPTPYAAGTTYGLADRVIYNSVAYESIQAGNTGHQPDISPLWWTALTGGVWGWPLGVTGGSVHVLPRSNNTGGTHNSLKQNCARVGFRNSGSGIRSRLHIWTDDDALVMYLDGSDMSGYVDFTYIGPYRPLAGLTVDRPLVMITSNSITPAGSYFGDTGGTDTYHNGGIVTRSGGVKVGYFDYLQNIEGTSTPAITGNPNYVYGTPRHMCHIALVGANETTPACGLCGEIDNQLFRWTYNALAYRRSSNQQQIVQPCASPGTANQLHYVLQWDGATASQSGSSRTGVNWQR